MPKTKLNLRKLSVTEKIQFARQIITSMTGNGAFPAPDPTLAIISTAASELENAYNDANITKQEYSSKILIQNDKEDVLDINLKKLSNYIDSASNGDDALIQSSGISLRAKPVPLGKLPIPEALSAYAGNNEGEIKLVWYRVVGARSYVVEISPDPITQSSWKYVGVATKASMTVTGLMSGVKYWFRVAAVGAAGQGPWSDPATKYAP